jgi:hypothetical protein
MGFFRESAGRMFWPRLGREYQEEIEGIAEGVKARRPETAYDKKDKFVHEAGLDVKYGLTNNLTMDLTVNTDFAQVEADDQQVNLTRFSLFFPEKRLFFQERASVFDFNYGDDTSLFYSRRIGLYEGQLVRIYGGARLVGRVRSRPAQSDVSSGAGDGY